MKPQLKLLSNIISESLWILPFIGFCIGYLCLQLFITDTTIQAPDLVGKNILEATRMSSLSKLNLQIIAEKEVTDAMPGTIIKQNPLPGKPIKSHQSIFIVITKQPAPLIAPQLIGKDYKEIERLTKDKSIKNRTYFLPSTYPKDFCFAQTPTTQQPLEAKKMMCYISSGTHHQYLFPDLTGINLREVVEFLQHYNISWDAYYKNQKITSSTQNNYTVKLQKPLAGTFVIPNNKLYVQLQVS